MKKYIFHLYFLGCICSAHAQTADKIAVLNDAGSSSNAPPSSFNQEVRFHFKWNAAIGVPHIGSPGAGTYSALMTIAPWSDGSASKHHQLDFNNEGLYWRKGQFGSSWEAWKQIVVADYPSGKVGIGTPTPSTKLEIVGTDADVALKVRHAGESTAWGVTIRQAADLKGYISCDGRDFQITAGWDKSLILGSPELSANGGKVIFPGGNVGIGTSTPDAKLTVKGDIHTREVKVDLSGAVGPDYVFEKDYNLTPLSELETYITKNKHLPEVPSAREMEANGLNLKEMNLLLLKKVEELTLHLIEMKKENDAQQARIDKQEKQIIMILDKQ